MRPPEEVEITTSRPEYHYGEYVVPGRAMWQASRNFSYLRKIICFKNFYFFENH